MLFLCYSVASVLWLGYITYEDIKTKLIDDRVILAGVLFFLPFSAYLNGWHFAFWGGACGLLLSLLIFAFGVLLSKITGKDSMGAGDVTVSVLIGIITGWQVFILVLCLAFFLHLFIGIFVCILKKDLRAEIPFMPAYFLAYLSSLFFDLEKLGLMLLKKWLMF